ncbi:hypothetical protein MES5069_670019 [Mesorhizobium escarrei]|uniref:Secreted protein n=1 Tax=Mesorhizobium escarrei TaxID=666018 RepID=A0ABM9EG63_9HYPH|nr:hypothetical protein MES5069_670019 [Mesorhizobium escarrei]
MLLQMFLLLGFGLTRQDLSLTCFAGLAGQGAPPGTAFAYSRCSLRVQGRTRWRIVSTKPAGYSLRSSPSPSRSWRLE